MRVFDPPPARALDHDLAASLARSPRTVAAAALLVAIAAAAALAPWLAPHDPFDPASLELMDALTPPVWAEGGDSRYLLGTDDQGRDLLSAMLWGSRVSLLVGLSAVLLAAGLGTALGVAAGYAGGWWDTALMRLADVQLTVPGLLVALLLDGVLRALLPRESSSGPALAVVIVAIGLAAWPHYARLTRGATLVEKGKDYVAAARITGVAPWRIVLGHVLPNVIGPVLVVGTIGLAQAITAEATLSFLGLGLPPTTPSLGTLIRVGNDLLLAGEWWVALFPAGTLALTVLAVNLLGDHLRDALNPKLR